MFGTTTAIIPLEDDLITNSSQSVSSNTESFVVEEGVCIIKVFYGLLIKWIFVEGLAFSTTWRGCVCLVREWVGALSWWIVGWYGWKSSSTTMQSDNIVEMKKYLQILEIPILIILSLFCSLTNLLHYSPAGGIQYHLQVWSMSGHHIKYLATLAGNWQPLYLWN